MSTPPPTSAGLRLPAALMRPRTAWAQGPCDHPLDWHAASGSPCCLRQTKVAEQASYARGLSGSAELAEVDLRFEVGARVGVGERLLELHLAALEERVQRLVEALDTALGALVDGFLDRHHVAFLDQGGDVGGVQHDLDGSHPPALLAHHQALRHDAAQVLRQVEEDLI